MSSLLGLNSCSLVAYALQVRPSGHIWVRHEIQELEAGEFGNSPPFPLCFCSLLGYLSLFLLGPVCLRSQAWLVPPFYECSSFICDAKYIISQFRVKLEVSFRRFPSRYLFLDPVCVCPQVLGQRPPHRQRWSLHPTHARRQLRSRTLSLVNLVTRPLLFFVFRLFLFFSSLSLPPPPLTLFS